MGLGRSTEGSTLARPAAPISAQSFAYRPAPVATAAHTYAAGHNPWPDSALPSETMAVTAADTWGTEAPPSAACHSRPALAQPKSQSITGEHQRAFAYSLNALKVGRFHLADTTSLKDFRIPDQARQWPSRANLDETVIGWPNLTPTASQCRTCSRSAMPLRRGS